MNLKKLFAAVLVLGAISGCATPKYLVADIMSTDRAIKYILTPTGGAGNMGGSSAKDEVLYDFIVRICDLDSNDQPSGCMDTVVVPNVIAGSIY